MPFTVGVVLYENFAETGFFIQISKSSSNTTKRAEFPSGSEPWSRDFFWTLSYSKKYVMDTQRIFSVSHLKLTLVLSSKENSSKQKNLTLQEV